MNALTFNKNGKTVKIIEIPFSANGATTYNVTQQAPGFFHEDTGFKSLAEAKHWVEYAV
ncbi:hypothetical protein N22_039 [Idiomarinaceae phage 1N2-2]|uniref:hypothetical protein n=1 Tax=Idiomarinaceae phage 1N2-2 TaxID=1536592 RepID=UPI0004F6CB36|nr:hypothetical protein N22_039 [Idiomarinaceae phage 1N2-2]AIM40741.1 hypothetical protein N22_039 [Idiomarinaceae phage 1N2-2]